MDTCELTHIIKLWLDENNTSKFWRVDLVPIHGINTFDVIEMVHIYNSINKHDNEVITIRLTIPHDLKFVATETKTRIGVTSNYYLGDRVNVSPGDPNFFEYLRNYVHKAMVTAMADLHDKLIHNPQLRYRGVYAKSSNIS